MKIIKFLKIAALILAYQMLMENAQASGTCLSDKSDISDDMNKIHAKISIKYANSNPKKVAQNQAIINKIYDEQQLKVDRTDSFLKQVNSVGIIADGTADTRTGYSTAVLISPCHVLVNAHAVTNIDAKNGKAPVYISLGQNSCDSNNEFAHQDMPGEVISIGDPTPEIIMIASAKDYAVVKIKPITDIDFSLVSTEFVSVNDSIATVGFPFKYTYSKQTGLRYPTMNITRKIGIESNGTILSLNNENLPGASGSGMFVLDENERGEPTIILGAIFLGPKKNLFGGLGLQTAAILGHLEKTNLQVYNQIKNAIQTKACN